MNTPFRLTAFALGLILSGCITPPKMDPQQQPLAETSLGLQAAPAVVADAAWWSAYDDAQLNRLMQAALDGNPSLAQALARVREAQSLADVTKAGLAPSVNFNAQETRQRFSGQDVIPPPYAGTVQWEGREGLNLSWDLDFWGRQSSLLAQSRSQARAAALDVSAARLALSAAVMQSYVDLYRSYALADVAQRAYEQRSRILEITRHRVAAGLDTKVELREAEAAVPQAQVQLSQAQAAVELAVHRLAALSGHGADAYAGITRPTLNVDAVLPLPQALPANLLGRRPDVLAARGRIEAATSGQAAAKAAFYPDVNLVAFAGTSAIGFNKLFESASGSYGAGPAISLPVFDAGRLKAEYRGAGAEVDSAVAGYNDIVLQAVRQASDQLSLIAALDTQLARQQQSLAASEDAYRLAELRYRSGLASYLTVLNAETAVLNARNQRVDLLSAQAIARVSLLLAVGGSFDPQAPLPV